MQISASASPAAWPPGVAMPASMTRAPPGSGRARMRSAAACARGAPAEYRHRPRNHPPPRLRSRVPRHHDQPAPGGGARLGARVAPNDDLATGHPAGGSRERAAGIVTGAPVHVDAPARHAATEVASHAAIDDELAVGHPGSYAFDLRHVAGDAHRGGPLTRHREEVAQERAPPAVRHWQLPDVAGAE